jgi:histone deacetylase complex regulatory component SIN3
LKDAPEAPETVPFPPPQTFEIIPPLHGILLRLLSPKPAQAGPSGVPGESTGALGASTDAQAQHQQAPSSIPSGDNNNPTTSQAIPEIPVHDSNGHPPLDVKDLPTATSSVRIRIQKARAVVEALPDTDRSVEEQQTEIADLEDRVARLRSVISDFGNRAKKPYEGRVEITSS